ncbi:MAG: 50S ribosomal protein L12 [Promethearchaeota archaeon]
MENVYSALILHTLGKEIDESSIEKIVKAAGGSADKNQIKTLVAALKELDIKEVLSGATMMAAAPAASSAAPAAKAEAAPAKEEKKEEEKEEDEEPVGLDALFG